MDDEVRDFVLGNYPALLRRGYLLTGDLASAEDLLQEALVRFCVAGRRRQITNPNSYVLQIMLNLQKTKWRKSKRDVLSLSMLPQPAIEDGADERAEHDRMWRALLTAPPRQRAVLVLRYYEGLSESEISQVLAVSVGTVRSQTAKGIARLKRALGAPASRMGSG